MKLRFSLIVVAWVALNTLWCLQQAHGATSPDIQKLLDEIDAINKQLLSIKTEVKEREQKIEEIRRHEEKVERDIQLTRKNINLLTRRIEGILPLYINWRKRLELLRTQLIAGSTSNLIYTRLKAGVLNLVYMNAWRKVDLFMRKLNHLKELEEDLQEAVIKEQLERQRLLQIMKRLKALSSQKMREVDALERHISRSGENVYSEQLKKVTSGTSPERTERESEWVFPVLSASVTMDKMGSGVVIRAPAGSPVVSVISGRITFSGWIRALGNVVIIMGDDGFYYIYAHLEDIRMSTGYQVEKGEEIGRVGSTGILVEDGLYFEVRRGSHPLSADLLLKRLKLVHDRS